MATIFIEGFDNYGPPSIDGSTLITLDTLLTQGEWTVSNTGGGINPGLSVTGYSLGMGGSGAIYVQRTLPTTYTTLIGGFRFSNNLVGPAPLGVAFLLNNTPQCAIIIVPGTGLIQVQSGTTEGTGLATSSVSVTANTVHYLEWVINFGSDAAFSVYLDGRQIINATGNTGTGCNQFLLGSSSNDHSIGASMLYDDVYLFDNTTSFNNNVLLTNPRIETSWPVSDSQTQWTNIGNMLGSNYVANSTTNNVGPNALLLRPYTSEVNCTINSVGFIPATSNSAANFKAVLYADNAGVAGSLIAAGTQVTGITANTPTTLPFSSGQSLVANTQYWIGLMTDTSINYWVADTLAKGYAVYNVYSNGAPATAPTMGSDNPSWVIWGNCTGATTNWESENQPSPPGDASAIQSQTVGNEDLYNFPALSHNPQVIYTVAVKGLARITTTGTRILTMQTKSGSNDSAGSNSSGSQPALSYAWIDSYFDTDPNTGAAWTPTAVNAAVSGPKVYS